MDPTRWKRIEAIYQSALEQPTEERPVFLRGACEGDEGLLREVEEMLEARGQAGSFLVEPAAEQMGLVQDGKANRNLIGTRLGAYEVLSPLGKGGMGEVYRARDTRLDRIDALKILPPELAVDPDRMRRFLREARAASALNHPNIATIYEVGESGGIQWISMELVEGVTLAERLKGRPLELDEILDIGIQIADALEEAHGKGIVHRDIKPSNLMITPNGQTKILDFGLAKVTRREGLAQTAESSETHTQPGLVMGTARYMSPEQVLGQPVDHRADIFSLGVVLYEMTTGRPPFAGETPSAIFDAIVHQTPSWPARVHARIPEELERTINKALEKFREMRYQSASDLRTDLRRLQDTDSGQAAVMAATAESRRQPLWKLLCAALVALILAVVGITWFTGRQIRPEPKQTRLTAAPGGGTGQISPDGRLLSYGDLTGVHVEVIESREVHDVPLPPERISEGGKWYPVGWFPDSTKFVALLGESGGHRSAWALSALGAPARKLRDDTDPQAPSPDGTQILHLGMSRRDSFTSSEIWLMSPQGEESRRILTAAENEWFGWPAWSPTGQRIAYLRYHGDGVSIESRDLGGGSPTVILPSTKSRIWHIILWGPDGRLFFTRDDSNQNQARSSLWGVKVDSQTGRPLGAPSRVCQWEDGSALLQSVTADGKRLAVIRGSLQGDVYVGQLEANGQHLKDLRRLTFDDHDDYAMAWTPDSKSVLFSSNRYGQYDIFKQALDRDSAEIVVTGPGNKRDLAVSPDGSWILYLQEAAGGSTRIMRVPIAGGPPQMACEGQGIDAMDCCWPPGNVCVFGRRTSDARQYLFGALDPIQGRGRELARVDLMQPVSSYEWCLSRDGARLAFTQAENNERDRRVRVIPLAGGRAFEFTLKGQTWLEAIQWSADGMGIYVGSTPSIGGGLLFVDMQGRSVDVLRQLRHPFYFGIRGVPSPDGRKLAVSGGVIYTNIWMLENF